MMCKSIAMHVISAAVTLKTAKHHTIFMLGADIFALILCCTLMVGSIMQLKGVMENFV